MLNRSLPHYCLSLITLSVEKNNKNEASQYQTEVAIPNSHYWIRLTAIICSHLDLLSVWLIAILTENMPIENIKLLMLDVLVDGIVGIPIRLEVIKLIFNIAFADSSSKANSNPLIKFSFVILLLKKWLLSFFCIGPFD